MSAVPVIITRAQPGTDQTASAVAELGLMPVLSPMLDLQRDPDVPLPDPTSVSGLVFTSANGVRFYAEAEPARDLPVWCVGPATATEAKQAGFGTVHESAGDSIALARFIAARSSPSDRPLLHVANSAATGDLARTLGNLGYTSMFAPLYRAVPATSLTDEVLECLAGPGPAILLIHSRKGAEAFIAAAKNQKRHHLHVVAISERAAAPLNSADMQTISIALAPNEDALLAALKHLAATLSA